MFDSHDSVSNGQQGKLLSLDGIAAPQTTAVVIGQQPSELQN
jgi:hypothetical protein